MQHKIIIMERNDITRSGFTLQHIVLIDSMFHREDAVSFDPKVENELNINTGVNVDGKTVNVMLQVVIDQQFEGKTQVKIDVKMIGVFECVGETPLADNLENFGRVNGAAIIFPYIREHISNLSIKAGIPPIVLPIVNFQNAGNQHKK